MTDDPATRPHPETDEPSADDPATLRAQFVEPGIVPRWVQLVLLPLGVLGLWVLARAAGPVLVIFLISGVIALILNPLVSLLKRRLRLPRGLAVAAVYLAFFIALAGVGFLLANPVADQIATFQADVPGLVDDANAGLDDLQVFFDDQGIDAKVSEQGSTALQTLQENVLQGSGDLVAFTRELLQRIAEATIALVLILVVSIYMLIYGPRIGARVRSIMPPGNGTPEDDYPTRVQRAVFGYVRGQVLFSLAMGSGAGVALWLFGAIGIFPDGKTYALFFGAFFGLMELVPYVGPIIGAVPPIVVALLQDPLTALWVTLLFIALQQVEGHVVAPLVFGQALRINPLLVIFSLAFGAQIYGLVGALMALPLAAIARETIVYLQSHLVLEPWGTPTAEAIAGGGRAPPPAPPPLPDEEPPEVEPEVGARQ
ncbi:MAG: AI-2E family transporter [Solirubrobacteraceae bacterium]